MSLQSSFRQHLLAPELFVYFGRLPEHLLLPDDRFEELWAMHPPERAEVTLGGRRMHTPRWHQAFGRDYEFSGAVSRALPVPAILQPMLEWTRASIDARINGILVNWYDAVHEHRIAQHRDSPTRRVPDCPIVTVSLGAARTFRMFVGKRAVPFRVGDGDVVVIPDATNKRCAHSVPHLPEDSGRRISVTLRGFVAHGDGETISG